MDSFEKDAKNSWFLAWFLDLCDIFLTGKEKLLSFFAPGKNNGPPEEDPEEDKDEQESKNETHTRSAMFDI